MSGQADFLPARIFVISFNIIIDIVYLSNLSGMNGIVIFSILLLILYTLYLLALFVAWYQARTHRIQRGIIGLPDVDSDQEPRTYFRIFGDICFCGLRFCCRMFSQH